MRSRLKNCKDGLGIRSLVQQYKLDRDQNIQYDAYLKYYFNSSIRSLSSFQNQPTIQLKLDNQYNQQVRFLSSRAVLEQQNSSGLGKYDQYVTRYQKYKHLQYPSSLPSISGTINGLIKGFFNLTIWIFKFSINIPKNIYFLLTMTPSQWKQKLSSIWKTIKEEGHHYWVGFKLFGYEISISQRLLRKSLSGTELTRRENRQLTRTTSDLIRMVPFIVIIAVPFMEFLLPVILYVFPGFLPSTFISKKKREEEYKKRSKSRLELANFLQDTIAQNAKTLQVTTTGKMRKSIENLSQFLENVRDGKTVTTEDILQFAPLFNDELTLDNLDKIQLVGLCQYMGLNTFGSNYLLRSRIRSRLAELKADDLVILREGIEQLDESELRSACRARGMRGAYGDGAMDFMKKELDEWIQLSVHKHLPSSLLLLSRVFSLTSQSRQAMAHLRQIDIQDLGKTIQLLPDELVQGVEADNIQDITKEAQKRIQQLKHEEEEIQNEERQRKFEDEKEKKKHEQEMKEQQLKDDQLKLDHPKPKGEQDTPKVGQSNQQSKSQAQDKNSDQQEEDQKREERPELAEQKKYAEQKDKENEENRKQILEEKAEAQDQESVYKHQKDENVSPKLKQKRA